MDHIILSSAYYAAFVLGLALILTFVRGGVQVDKVPEPVANVFLGLVMLFIGLTGWIVGGFLIGNTDPNTMSIVFMAAALGQILTSLIGVLAVFWGFVQGIKRIHAWRKARSQERLATFMGS